MAEYSVHTQNGYQRPMLLYNSTITVTLWQSQISDQQIIDIATHSI